MRHFRRAALLGLAVAGCLLPGTPDAQQDDQQLAARCAELGRLFDRFAGPRGEGSPGRNMQREGAAIDCSRGRYDRGIRSLEELLNRNRIPFPPA